MNATELARGALAAFTQKKRVACDAAGGPKDLMAQLHLVYPTKGVQVAGLPNARDDVPTVLTASRARMGEHEILVAFLSDAYWRVVDDEGEDIDDLKVAMDAGDLQVREQLMAVAIDVRTDEVVSMCTPYHYDDRGRPKFGKTKTLTSLEGPALNVMRRGVR